MLSQTTYCLNHLKFHEINPKLQTIYASYWSFKLAVQERVGLMLIKPRQPTKNLQEHSDHHRVHGYSENMDTPNEGKESQVTHLHSNLTTEKKVIQTPKPPKPFGSWGQFPI